MRGFLSFSVKKYFSLRGCNPQLDLSHWELNLFNLFY